MNKKGQTLGISIMVAIVIFMVGMVIVNILKPELTTVKNSANLDCSNAAGISDGTKLTCLVVDIVIPYFIIIIFSVAGGLITRRFLI